MQIVLGLFFIALAAVLGGFLARIVKVPSLAGYIIAGTIVGALLPESLKEISSLAQIGTILLLFSIGVELSFDRLSKFLKVSVFGSLIQIILVTVIFYVILGFFGVGGAAAVILAAGFSLSSTAVVVKMLADAGEIETIHGGIMLAWLLVQDLAVIPMMVILPLLGSLGGGWEAALLLSLGKAILVVVTAIFLGRLAMPFLLHKVAEANSRELLLLASVGLALGTAAISSVLGISPALGAFLAGVVISESQERHAVFAETRPLRDLFVALFFVTLGFLVNPAILVSKAALIIILAVLVLVVKSIVVFTVGAFFGYRGRVGVTNSFGLAQVGEFSFVIFSAALGLKLLTPQETSLGITVTLITLILSPLLFGGALTFWRRARQLTAGGFLAPLFASGEKREIDTEGMTDHIIICGFGRVGKWVGRALGDFGIPFVVVEYNQKVVSELKEGGVSVLYGDPTEPEVLEAVGIRNAKAVILAIPDRVAQETLITYVQTVAPSVKIISRAHLDSDWEKLKTLKVDKIVQPEFEAAIEIIRSILVSRGKTREEIHEAVKSLRVSHSK